MKRWASAVAVVVVLCAAAWAQAPVRSSALVDGAALLRDLETLAADDMQGRQVGTAGGEKARAYVLRRFKESGLAPFGETYEQPFAFAGRANAPERKGANVIGRIDGSKQPRRYIVVTAHFDHIGVRNGEVFNGADDNASGTAALFAIGRHFARQRPANSLVIAALDGEEAGLRGAQAFIKSPPVDLASLVINVNLDMIGRDASDTLYAVGTYLQPFLRPYLERVAVAAPVKLVMGHDNPNERGVEDWTRQSDHSAFHQAGLAFVYLGVEDFAQHHKATDDYATMTHDFYVRAVETAIAVIREFDANLDAIAAARQKQ